MAKSYEEINSYDVPAPEAASPIEISNISFLNLAGDGLEKVILCIKTGTSLDTLEAA